MELLIIRNSVLKTLQFSAFMLQITEISIPFTTQIQFFGFNKVNIIKGRHNVFLLAEVSIFENILQI